VLRQRARVANLVILNSMLHQQRQSARAELSFAVGHDAA
jgi:hypothetical protein